MDADLWLREVSKREDKELPAIRMQYECRPVEHGDKDRRSTSGGPSSTAGNGQFER